jgi:tetratricopeptide (TPR) repeat protein
MPFSPAKLLAVVVGGLVVCSLVATTLGTAWLQGPPVTAPAATGDDEYERALLADIAADPDDSVALVSLANLLSTRGNHGEAIDHYERAIALDPDNPSIRLDFALALAESGNEPDAELQYQRVLETNPDDAEALYFLGQLYAGWQPPRTAEAAAAFERVIVAAPESVSASQAELALAGLRGLASPEPGP